MGDQSIQQSAEELLAELQVRYAALTQQNAELRDELRLAALVFESEEGMLITDAKSKILRVNRAFTRLTGFSSVEAIGQTPGVFNANLHSEETFEALRASLRANGFWQGDIFNRRKDGRVYPERLNISALRDANGAVSHYVASFTDISAEQDSKNRLAHLAAIVSSSTDAIISKSLDGIVTSWNAGAAEMYGYTADEAIGSPMQFLIPDDRTNEELEVLERIARGDTIDQFETVRRRKDAQLIDISATISPLLDENAKVVGACNISRDITEHKQAQEALRASEARRKVATDSGRLAIWEVDIASNRLTWDDNCFALYRIRKEDFTGKFEEWARAIHPQDLDAVVQAYQQAIAGTQAYHLTFRIVWPDGCVRFIEAHGDVIHGVDGVAKGMIGVNWDITEQKNSEEALHVLVTEKTALLQEVHHRVKNNLQVITSLLRLESHRNTVDQTKQVLGDMQARIRAMALLHEALYRSGNFATVDLGSYLRELSSQSFRAQDTNSGAVQLALNVGSVQVSMDQAIPCGLLVNELISNCLKHAFPGGAAGLVSLDLQPLGAPSQWCLRVSDTGVGLPENFEEKSKNSLGLQLVGDLARQIRGELMITPNQDKGVSFTVNFHALEPAPLVMPA